MSILPATPHLIQRAKKSDRKLTAAGGFALKSYGVVEETIDIGFGPKAWIFYVVESHNPLLGKDFFQHNFLTWKYVPDDGSRTIMLRVGSTSSCLLTGCFTIVETKRQLLKPLSMTLFIFLFPDCYREIVNLSIY